MEKGNRTLGIGLALFTAIVSGISVFLNGTAVKLADPVVYTLLKNVGVLLLLGALMAGVYRRKHFENLTSKQWQRLALIGVIGGGIAFALFFSGLKMEGAAAGSFLYRSLFIFAGVWGYLLLREKPEPRDVLAGMLILAGNAVLLGGGWSAGIGTALVLVATLLWALEYTLSRQILAEVHPQVVMAARMFFGALVLLAYTTATGSIGAVMTISGEVLAWLALTALMLGFFLLGWYNALKRLPVSKATVILALGGIVTALLDQLFLNKAITPTSGAGLLLIAGGVGVSVGIAAVIQAAKNWKAYLDVIR